ncbi:hypothetical protein DERF_001960 [Dermatophagoides farinae]|uniref:Uncharacterized protein n=1 Tax=Dermatophagoides farinae TaxID=6954 RepID=A0A922LD57_DERFA|nr:hypothetical protein DERF_001960 [Dermatophagoides farinae]
MLYVCVLCAFQQVRVESVSTTCDNSPTFKANAASSNGFCIAPRAKNPKSPPRLADEQSDSSDASSSNVATPFEIFS